MKNILKISAIAASSLLTAQTLAADATGTANFNLVYPITVTEQTQMQFGDIDITADGTCTLNTSNAVSGTNCSGAGSTPASGNFQITAANGPINLSVSGADTSIAGITFTPVLASSSTTVTGNSANVNVGGTVAVVASAATAGAKSLSYTLSVTY